MEFQKCLCLFLTLFSFVIFSSHAYKFNVGGKEGWVINPRENYNQWAERNRFFINDTLFFKYKKGSESVLLVNKDDYNNCNTKQPLLKMDSGESEFKFDRSGPFYFISGNPDHCQKGQKLIVIVLSQRGLPSPPVVAPSPNSPSPAMQPPKVVPPSSSSQAPKGSSPVPATSPSTSPTSQSPSAYPPKGLSPAPATSPPTSPSANSPGPAASSPPNASSPVPSVTPSSSPIGTGPAQSPGATVSPPTPTPSTGNVPSPSPTNSGTPAEVTPPPSDSQTSEPPRSTAVATSLSLRVLGVSLVSGLVLSYFVGAN